MAVVFLKRTSEGSFGHVECLICLVMVNLAICTEIRVICYVVSGYLAILSVVHIVVQFIYGIHSYQVVCCIILSLNYPSW